MSMNDKVAVEIAGRKLELEIEGLMPMQISLIAAQVDEKIKETKRLHPKEVDTFKLFIHTLVHQEAALFKLQDADSTNRKAVENTLDRIATALQKSLDAETASGAGKGK